MDKIVTHTGVTIDSSYIDCYLSTDRELLDIPLQNDLPVKIAEFLPNNYIIADIGSPDGKTGREIAKEAAKLGKVGKCIDVDPFSTNASVIRSTGEQFMEKDHQPKFDAILLKHSIHFMKKPHQFFENCYKNLRANGLIYNISLNTGSCQLPWTSVLQKHFETTVPNVPEMIPPQLFTFTFEKEEKQQFIDRKNFIKLVKGKGWSNLWGNTQEEINECIEILQKNQNDKLWAKTGIGLYIISKAH